MPTPSTTAAAPDDSARAAIAMTPATAPATAPDATTRRTRAIAAGALLALVALGLAWELWLAPTGGRTWAIKVLPLALGIAGVLKYRLRTYRWLSLLVWLYVAEGVVRATTERMPSTALAALQGVLGLLLFGACAAHVRWRLKRGAQLRAAAAAREDVR